MRLTPYTRYHSMFLEADALCRFEVQARVLLAVSRAVLKERVQESGASNGLRVLRSTVEFRLISGCCGGIYLGDERIKQQLSHTNSV
jgi:hypothetical protein